MVSLLKDIKQSIFHLAFPQVCEGCGSDVLEKDHLLCVHCLSSLPKTDYHLYRDNPVEKVFRGRLQVESATAQYYFTKQSLVQHLMHQLKYKGNKALGIYLGKLIGYSLASSDRFKNIDALVPLPLFPSKERKRGYNQATVLCQGIAEVLHKPVLKDVIRRTMFTETQTKKSRVERWQNIDGKFELVKPGAINGKHILLVDDVITTGATLEACGKELMAGENVQLSIATLCFSSH